MLTRTLTCSTYAEFAVHADHPGLHPWHCARALSLLLHLYRVVQLHIFCSVSTLQKTDICTECDIALPARQTDEDMLCTLWL